MAPQAPDTAKGSQGQTQQVHALIDKGFRRQHLALAWEKVQKHRGSAGIDDVTMAPCEARPQCSLDLLHRQRREGTYRPQPVTRVELPTSEGGVRKLGLPAVLERVCQQALVQRMEPLFEPTCLDSAFGYRRGRSPHGARRQVWGERHNGHVWIVEADRRQCFDTIDPEPRIDVIAEDISDGRVLQLVRDMRRAGGLAGGGGKPPRTGGPHGGVASPWGSTICLTPFDRQRPADGFRLTRWADDVVVWCQTREAAQRALAVAARCLRAAVGVEGHPQKTRVVPVSQGVEFLGDKVKQGSGYRLPAHKRRGRSKPQHL